MMLLSLAPLEGCAVDGGPGDARLVATREGPRHGTLQPAPVEMDHPPESAPPSGTATADQPDDASSPPRETGQVYSVSVGPGSFSPAIINIHLGDAVEFTWETGRHSVTSGFLCKADGMFASGLRAYPASYRVTFLRTGVFPFFSDPECEEMAGLITVTATSP